MATTPDFSRTPNLTEISSFNYDWRVYLYDGSNLIFGASNSLAYGHALEIQFSDTSYLCCPTEFYCPEFRLATGSELTKLVPYLDTSDDVGMIIDAESSNSTEKIPFLVCAGSYKIQWNNVSYVSDPKPNDQITM